MAILGHFECQVLVNGEPLKEYEDEGDEQDHDDTTGEDASSRLSVKYIEATANANFAIKFHVKPGFQFDEADYLGMKMFLDGQFGGGPVLTRDEYYRTKNHGWLHTRFGVRSGNDTEGFEMRKFRFGELVTGDLPMSPNMEELKLKYAPLGSIKVAIWRKKTLSISRGATGDKPKPEGVIPEKMLKGRALTLRISLGEVEKNVSSTDKYEGKKLDDHPIAAFVFRYRSTEALKQLLVIPRTRSPTPLEERPIEALSMEELRERLRRRETEAKGVQIKKEETADNPHTPLALKRFREDMGSNDDKDVVPIAERSAHKKQRPALGQEVIELSD